MNKRIIWIIGLLCTFFSAHGFAKGSMSLKEIENLYSSAASISSDKAQNLLYDMLYKDFFFHKAAEACSLATVNFFLDKITDITHVEQYMMKVRKPYGEIEIDPYQQAVISNCLPAVQAIDNKIMEVMRMRLKTRVDPYAACNSNLHLMILAKSNHESKSEINRDMVRYFLTDTATPFLKNLDDCKPVDILDLNRKQVSNYVVIRHEILSSAIGNKAHLEEWADRVLENCRVGHEHFVASKSALKN